MANLVEANNWDAKKLLIMSVYTVLYKFTTNQKLRWNKMLFKQLVAVGAAVPAKISFYLLQPKMKTEVNINLCFYPLAIVVTRTINVGV